MYLINEALIKVDYNDRIRKYSTEANLNKKDYGYALYQSLEYDFKYLKSEDLGFLKNLMKITLR